MHTGSRSWFSLSVLFIFIYFSFHQRTNFYFSANHKYWSAEYQILLSFSPLLFSNAQTFNTKSYENTSTVKTFIIIQCWFIYWEAVLISLDLSVQCVCVCVCVYLLRGVAACVQCVCAVQFTLSLSVEQRHVVACRLCCTRWETNRKHAVTSDLWSHSESH